MMIPARIARPRPILRTQRTEPSSLPWRASWVSRSMGCSWSLMMAILFSLFRRMARGHAALQFADRSFDLRRQRAVIVGKPGPQNLHSLGVGETAIAHHIAGQPVETARPRLDVFEQL